MEQLLVSKAEFQPLLSEYRLGKIYKGSEDMLHPELTLPVEVEPLGEIDPVVARNPGLEAAIADHMRVIVTPLTARRLRPELIEQLEIMIASPDSGRVMEADQEVEVDGKKYVLTVKGGGATGYVRDAGEGEVFGRALHTVTPADVKEKLKKFPFWDHLGAMGSFPALNEKQTAGSFEAQNVHVERVPGVYAIKSLPDVYGVYRPIQDFYAHNIGLSDHSGGSYIGTSGRPVLLPRLVTTNVRLFHPILLTTLKRFETAEHVVNHLRNKLAATIDVPTLSVNEYYSLVMNKALGQEFSLILKGYQMMTGGWKAVARNISGVGEELDPEEIPETPIIKDAFWYYGNFEDGFTKLYEFLHHFTQSIRFLSDYVATERDCLDRFVDLGRTSINSTDFESVYLNAVPSQNEAAKITETARRMRQNTAESLDLFARLESKRIGTGKNAIPLQFV